MRGKHGASAAKRRAESAEEQLDRLLPKLIDAERTAKRYASEAAAAPVLRAELKKLRDVVGVPVADHEAALKRQRDEWDAQRVAELHAWKTIVDDVATLLDQHKVDNPDYMPLSSALALRALRTVPRELAEHVLARLGIGRDARRFMLEDTSANRSQAEGKREATRLAVVARAAGIKGGIPASWARKDLHELADPDGAAPQIAEDASPTPAPITEP